MEEALIERVPPQNIEAEQAVLGAILIDPDVLTTVTEVLQPEDFYRTSHQRIFSAMCAIGDQGEPVDLVTVTAYLQDNNQLEEIGGVSYLATLANAVPTSANVDYYANIVHEKAVLRRLIRVATQIASSGYDGSSTVSELIDDAERRIFEIAQEKTTTRGFTPIRDILMTTFERIEYLYNNRGGVSGIPSGYPDLDKMTSGWQKSDFIIVAARPSVGKTAFALNVAQNVAKAGYPVAIFSLEMSKEQLVQRIICAEANLDAGRMRTGFLEEDDWPKLTMAIATLSETPIFIDDTPNVTVSEIRSKCRRLQAEHGLGLILMDFLQVIQGRGKGDNRQQEVSEISRTLKMIARELNVPVIALSQLSRSVEQRQDKRPLMSDLRESGSIEQDADIVAFLYRDDYYDPESEKKNIVEIIIAKQRNGPTGKVELVFLKNFNKFVSLERTPA
ncbi:replicative DNA helicase [Collibacillus ludicampi]|uniref:Replicative DNA helicase n=1 Tax=Collibacillus ludicampi TaxID=2771369 RepID=A0AAV4LDJ1_9BACL|nr:replicative DNA helicase [Collibacillus ludicampi]GIM45857.1 replicative DNA helicase [Collibacillus ludicampi]